MSNITKNAGGVEPKDIAEELLGKIDWQTETKGYCACPGKHLHNGKTGDRDCIVYLDGAATIHCMHQSCLQARKEASQQLRKAIAGGAPAQAKEELSVAELKRLSEMERQQRLVEARIANALPRVLTEYNWPYNQILKDSVTAIPVDPTEHWKYALGLFQPTDIVWNGDVKDTGRFEHRVHFRTVEDWLRAGRIGGPFTCPATFKPESYSRCKDSALHQRFLVVESDILSKNQVGAIFRWLKDAVGLTLRMVVDTAGKSLHGWFDRPGKEILEHLEKILPQLGCDPGMFRLSQPCRMPGAPRNGKYQRVIYLDQTAGAGIARMPLQQLPLPAIYYDNASQIYWRETPFGTWQKINEGSLEIELVTQGLDAKPKFGELLSEVKTAKRTIQTEQDVVFAGPLAGYQAGLHVMHGQRVLVTASPKIIEPVNGDWFTLKSFFKGLLGNEQQAYFGGWLRQAYQSLRTGKFTPGQALAVVGPANCGKSLLQALITECLGGRSAKPYQYMTDGTGFNADLFAGEHLMIEDEVSSTDIRARRHLGSKIKEITVNTSHRCHAKNKTPLMLDPFWRLSISVNNEPENLLILPPLDESLLDKIIILKADFAEMPMPTGTPDQRKLFWDTLVGELPAFLHAILTWEIPYELRDERFGIKAYQHPEIVGVLSEVQPEERLLAIIESEIFLFEPNGWSGSAIELEKRLIADGGTYRREAEKLLSHSNTCGTYLGRLAKKYPDRVTEKVVQGKRVWTLQPVKPTVGGGK